MRERARMKKGPNRSHDRGPRQSTSNSCHRRIGCVSSSPASPTRSDMDDERFDFDWDYEFDAPSFFDFTALHQPQHDLADRWFLFANSYPPSPLIVKLKWGDDECGEEKENKSQLRPNSSRSSTLLKPTASYLAKISRRTQNPGNSVNLSGDTIATKRQKLENGYLKKVIPFSSGPMPSKSKVTVARGPNLETDCRARRFRAMKSACQGDTKKGSPLDVVYRFNSLRII